MNNQLSFLVASLVFIVMFWQLGWTNRELSLTLPLLPPESGLLTDFISRIPPSHFLSLGVLTGMGAGGEVEGKSAMPKADTAF